MKYSHTFHIFFITQHIKTMKRAKSLSAFLIAALMFNTVFAAGAGPTAPDLASWASSFWTVTIAPLFPWIVAGTFVITMVFNLGELSGDNKNYKAFFTKCFLFAGGVAAVMIMVNWYLGLSLA